MNGRRKRKNFFFQTKKDNAIGIFRGCPHVVHIEKEKNFLTKQTSLQSLLCAIHIHMAADVRVINREIK